MNRLLMKMLCLAACALAVSSTPAPETEARARTTAPRESCASCAGTRPADPERMNAGLVDAVKRHILSRLQMTERPNITQSIPRAAMVTALRKLHAGKVREDGRVEIPEMDGHASYSNDVEEETSEIISFAETGACVRTPSKNGHGFSSQIEHVLCEVGMFSLRLYRVGSHYPKPCTQVIWKVFMHSSLLFNESSSHFISKKMLKTKTHNILNICISRLTHLHFQELEDACDIQVEGLA